MKPTVFLVVALLFGGLSACASTESGGGDFRPAKLNDRGNR